MSFGFDVGNFADAAHLAYVIYRDCWKVAKGAPQEFQLLVSEVQTLSCSLKILEDDVQDPESSLVQAGDDRVKLVNDMVGNIRVTLTQMEKIARKYEIIGSTSASKGKQIWTRFKWTFDWSTTEKLRGKLHQHNTMMTLLLTQLGNSSLQRLQGSTNAVESDVHEIRKFIAVQQGDKVGSKEGTPTPFLSLEHDEVLVTDDMSRSSLSASLLKHAETHQPWTTIGVSQWIETGTWWLLRAQLEIRPITTPGSTITKSAYLALIKASWILIDIITCHPQLSFVSSTTRGHIAALSTAIKQEFEKMKLDGLTVESLKSLNDEDLYIWEGVQGKVLYLKPRTLSSAGSLETSWAVDGDERCLFLAVAKSNFTVLGLNICIVMFLVQPDGRASRLVAKQQNGEVILDIGLKKPVELLTWETDRKQVTVDGQEIMFDAEEDAERLLCLIETAKIYHLQRTSSYFSVQAFIFWTCWMAVKSYDKELVSTLHPAFDSNNSPFSNSHSNDHESRLYQVTASLIRKFLDEDGIFGLRYDVVRARKVGLLHWAIWIGNPGLVNLLMLEGLTATNDSVLKLVGLTSTKSGEISPLHIAALYGHDDMAHTIVASSSKDAKTLARERDGDGKSALCYAAYYGHEKVARSLLRWGANPNSVSGGGETALHVAAEEGHANVVELLLEKGARKAARNRRGRIPFSLAWEAKRESVIAVFAKNELDITFRDKDGRNAWQAAIASGIHRVFPQSIFDLMMQSFWVGQKPQMPLLKHRLAIVSFEVNTQHVILTLDSRYARFEHPKPLPSHIIDLFGRGIKVKHGAKHFSSSTIEFHIIHACETLDFSTDYGKLSDYYWPGRRLGADDNHGFTSLIIRGGGGFESRPEAPFFQNHENIATDPNAEEIP